MIETAADVAHHDNPGATKSPAPDWLKIEADYRAGILSLRQIASKAGTLTEAAVRKRARRLGWTRDLSVRIRAKAVELVRTDSVRSVGTQYATGSEAVETAIIQDNAEALAHVEITQRRNISRARSIVSSLFAELERTTCDRSGEVMVDPARVRPASGSDCGHVIASSRASQNRGISLPARAATAKALADALRTLVSLERQVWQMDGCVPASADAGRVIDSSKLTWEQRQQLREMILKAAGDETPTVAVQPRD